MCSGRCFSRAWFNTLSKLPESEKSHSFWPQMQMLNVLYHHSAYNCKMLWTKIASGRWAFSYKATKVIHIWFFVHRKRYNSLPHFILHNNKNPVPFIILCINIVNQPIEIRSKQVTAMLLKRSTIVWANSVFKDRIVNNNDTRCNAEFFAKYYGRSFP